MPRCRLGTSVQDYSAALVVAVPSPKDIAIVSLRNPLSRDTSSAIAALPQEGAIPPLGAFFYTDIEVRYPHFATYRAILVRYPRKTSTKTFCDTIAQSIARYEKYRYWASYLEASNVRIIFPPPTPKSADFTF